MHRPQVVRHVARWQGWCTPCQSEQRPLVLTRSGPGGVRSWLAGLDDDDRTLLLTCVVCGDWQVVPAREEDDPEVLLVEDEPVLEVAAEVVPVQVAVEVAPLVVEPAVVEPTVVEPAAALVVEPAATDVRAALSALSLTAAANDERAAVTARLGTGLSALLTARTAAAALPAPREAVRPALRVVRGGADPASVALPSSDPLSLVHLAAVGS